MIQVVAVGRLKERAMVQLVEEYQKRIGGYARIQIDEVADEPNDDPHMAAAVKQAEGQRILRRLRPRSYVILLDLQGKELTSEQLAAKMQDVFTYHGADVTFVIGGSLGVSPEVRSAADYVWKLSALTFPHNLARLILLEQVYRGFKILAHEPYHK